MIFFTLDESGETVDNVIIYAGDVANLPDEFVEAPEGSGVKIGMLYDAETGELTAADGEHVPTQAEIVATYTQINRNHLDDMAKLHGFDTINTAVSYANEPSVAEFQRLGVAFSAWRSAVYRQSHLIYAQVFAGQIALPTPDDYVAMLPILEVEPLDVAALV